MDEGEYNVCATLSDSSRLGFERCRENDERRELLSSPPSNDWPRIMFGAAPIDADEVIVVAEADDGTEHRIETPVVGEEYGFTSGFFVAEVPEGAIVTRLEVPGGPSTRVDEPFVPSFAQQIG